MDSLSSNGNLENVKDKVVRLIQSHSRLKEELEEMKVENERLKKIIKEQNEKINDFQYKSKISRIVESLAVDDEDPLELKAKIDEYIKEIDNCIVYLDKQL